MMETTHQTKNLVEIAASQNITERDYWLRKLSGPLIKTSFPHDYKKTASEAVTPTQSLDIHFSPGIISRVTAISKGSEVRIFIVLATAVVLLLNKITDNNDIIVGTPIYKQDQEGEFINTVLALRNTLQSPMTFKDLLMQVSQTLMEAVDHQNYPIDMLKHQLDMPDAREDFSLFDTVVLLENIHDKKYIRHIHPNIVFSFSKGEETLEGQVEYNSLLYRESTIEQMIRYFHRLLAGALFNVDEELSALGILSEEEKHRILEEFNHTYLECPAEQSINEIFTGQAAQTPHHTTAAAVSFHPPSPDMEYLSYKELDERSRYLAFLLQEKGVKSGTIIGLMVERSLEMIIGILAILKAGGAYLPIDPYYPGDRINYMLADSSTKILLSDVSGAVEVGGNVEIIDIAGLMRSQYKNLPPTPMHLAQPLHHHLAYIIYTSGSTGHPKGTLVEQRNLVNLVWGLKERIYRDYPAPQKVTLVAPGIFDASVKMIFAVLLLGHSLYIVPEEVRMDSEGLVSFYKKYQIHIADGTPLHLRLLWEYLGGPNRESGLKVLSGIKHFIIGGEELPGKLAEQFLKCFDPVPPLITNVYGPTECCVVSTCYRVLPGTSDQVPVIPIGNPMPNVQVYILDKAGQSQPIGVIGELFISGNGVSRGYLNRPELTGEKFVDNPFIPGKRMYRSGDLARWLTDSNIEFRGRQDHQVKIRGYRVELGEIENRLLNHKDIREVVATALEEQGEDRADLYIAAYFVSQRKFQLSELRGYLSGELPQYMMPAYFVPLEKMPVTTNGKIDRKALPLPKSACLKSETTYVAPMDDNEKQVIEIWKEILKQDTVGIDDNFFDIGGNSLHLIRLNSRLKEAFARDIPVASMFRYPTVRSFVKYLTGNESQDDKIKTAAPTAIELTPARASGSEVAVIGMSGRFPGAKNIREFWNNLKNGVESISFFADEELKQTGIEPGMLKERNYVKARAILEEEVFEYFDARFFGYTPHEAEIMDPQVRLFHECAWEALEDAGYCPESPGISIGLYAGASTNTFWEALVLLSGRGSELGQWTAGQLANKDHLCSRISYKLNLNGPVFTVLTACSTSLVAIHLASRAIISGECDMALAGGVAIALPNRGGYIYQDGMVSSPDGHCRAFDAAAAGMVAGSGAGVVVLKNLQKAILHRDHIYAVVIGSAVNSDGSRRVGYTAPSVEGQAEVIRSAIKHAGIEPETIGYVETHGTATPLGDTVEIEALKLAFASDKKSFCSIGSVKTNVGHLDTAAGAAGFIKTVLALNEKVIPPSLHFNTPNPKIDFENSPFYVNARLKEWKTNDSPLRAGVSSFGIGGTNAHVILEASPERTGGLAPLPDEGSLRQYHLILLSAKTETALQQASENLTNHLRENPGLDLANVAYTLQVGRKAFPFRRKLLCSSTEEIIRGLSTTDAGTAESFQVIKENSPLVFMFPGQGSQYVNMGLGLYQAEPVFRQEIDRCFEILKGLVDDDIKEVLYPGEMDNRTNRFNRSNRSNRSYNTNKSYINQTEIAQPVLFIIEYALAKLLKSWGITPYAMMGHSIGEYTAACLAGVFSLEDALNAVVLRGKLMGKLPAGAMLSVPLPEEELQPLLTAKKELSLAAVNTTSRCVVSGPAPAIEAFAAQLKARGHVCRPLHTSHAFHSAMMEPMLAEFGQHMAHIPLKKPVIPYISNLTGQWINPGEVVTPGYWTRHLRHTVRFADGLTQLLKKDHLIFLEVGPGDGVVTFVRQHQDIEERHITLNLVRPPRKEIPDHRYLLDNIGRLWLYGKIIDWYGFHSTGQRQRVQLPTYPFQRERYWIEGDPYKIGANLMPGNWKKGETAAKQDLADWFYLPAWTPLPLLSGHKEKIPGNPGWLLFVDNCGPGDLLVRRLKKEGQRVVTVTAADEYHRSREGNYQVNPARDDDYYRLFNELARQGEIPAKIIHLWSLTGSDGDEWSAAQVEAAQEKGFYSLINIARAIGAINKQKLASNGDFQLEVISNRIQNVLGDETVSPPKATIMAPVKVIPQEYVNITCRVIDIVIPRDPAKGFEQEQLVEQLWKEISLPSSHKVIAYRGSSRWVQTFTPIHLEEKEKAESRLLLRDKGVYLITGGLGHIGMILARYLARNWGARLVLTGRTPMPPRHQWDQWLSKHSHRQNQPDPISQRISQLKELETLGAKVLTFGVDVTDYQQMQQVITQAEQQLGQINGVLHLAGLVGTNTLELVENTRKEHYQKHLHPKIYGLKVLEKIFRDTPLDFVWVMSSLSSVLGGLGFAAYAGANIFMDAFVQNLQHRQTLPRHAPWISVNWDGLEENQTESAFERIIALVEDRIPQVVVSDGGNLQRRIHQWIKLENREKIGDIKTGDTAKTGISTAHPRPRLVTPYVPPQTQQEKILARIWQDLFGIDSIGIHDDFLELGGDSLKAITLLTAIHKQLKVELPLTVFFKEPTIEKVAQFINKSEISTWEFIKPVEEKEYYSLSAAQKRLSILHQIDAESTAYNVPQTVILEGNPDRTMLEGVFRSMIRRHEGLRTAIELIGEEPAQKIYPRVAFELEYHEAFSPLTGPGSKTTGPATPGAEKIIQQFIRPFDLTQPPFIRAGLIKIGQNRHILVIDMHHLVTDGISHEIFVKEVMALYAGLELPFLRIRYKDYSRWQNSDGQKAKWVEQEAYWLSEFAGEIPELNLPTDYPRPVIQRFTGSSLSFAANREDTGALKALAREQDATMFMVILAIYNILLSKISSQEDLVVGTPVAGRNHPDLERIIGVFINTLALRNYPGGEKSAREFLRELRLKSLAAFGNQDYPFENLVEKLSLNINRDAGRNPLFDVFIVFHTPGTETEHTTGTKKSGLKVKPYPHQTVSAKFDLSLTAVERNDGIDFILDYSTALFKKETIQRFSDYFKTVLSLVAAEPDRKISHLEIISKEEKHRVLHEFNVTRADYPREKTIHHLFTRQAKQKPHQVVLAGSKEEGLKGKMQLSCGELNEKANQVACLLMEKGVQPDTIVAIMLERSLETVIGILGILKAEGAYLPIDPEFPGERINYMLADSAAKILVVPQDLPGEIQFANDIVDLSAAINGVPITHHDFSCPSRSSSLVYIIYTSGTTGRPKGVLLSHENLVNYVHWFKGEVALTPEDRSLLTSSLAFDLGYTSLYPPLLSGAALFIISREDYSMAHRLLSHIQRDRITYLKVTPSLFSTIVGSPDFSAAACRSLRLVVMGGEPINVMDVEQAYQVCADMAVINHYGPTEATIGCVAQRVNLHQLKDYKTSPTIGRPIANTGVYILDRHLTPVPVGIPGELCVFGKGLGRGYLNNPGLTMERFDHNKSFCGGVQMLHGAVFSKRAPLAAGGKIYHTGDLARWVASGNIQFLGRIDNQVKIRGFRIELGEIEARLMQHEQIREAVVIARVDRTGDHYLCAYIAVHQEIPLSQLKEYLSGGLPGYMVPAYFIRLEQIPLTPNGKVDKKALPAPEMTLNQEYVPPTNEIEEKLVGIWSEILGIDTGNIGIHSEFFQLGGHSLKATVMLAKVHKTFNVRVPLAELFKKSSLAALAQYIKGAAGDKFTAIASAEQKEYYHLSSAQKRLYFLHRMESGSTAYNLTHIATLNMTIGIERLEETFSRLIKRHESLRTAFLMVNEEPVQKVYKTADVEIESPVFAGSRAEAEKIIENFVKPFDLSRAPLLRVGLILTSPSAAAPGSQKGENPGDRCILLVDMHHIISDGLSMQIIERECAALFGGEYLPPLRVQYKDYSQWQGRMKNRQRETMARQEAYWEKQFAGTIPILNLPTDKVRPIVQAFEGSARHFQLGKGKPGVLRELAAEENTSMYVILLTVLNIFLSKLSLQEDIIVGTPTSGRRHADLVKIIGMFVNTLALRNYPNGEKTFKTFLREVKERTFEAFENQEYPFEDLVELVPLNRDISRNPLFDVMITFNTLDSTRGTPAEEEYDGLYEGRISKFDLTLHVRESRDTLFFTFEYSTGLFRKETIQRFSRYFENLLSRIIENPEEKVSAVEMIPREEKRWLLFTVNNTGTEYPENKTIQRLFEEQVEKTPGNTALVVHRHSTTYRELNKRVNQSAAALRLRGVRPGTVVGLMAAHSLEMVVAVLAILKAGGAYLPIDSQYPKERINFMLEDSQARLLLTHPSSPLTAALCFNGEVAGPEQIPQLENPQQVNKPHHLAYVIYTSGSTGKPKGVMVQHQGLVNYITWAEKVYLTGKPYDLPLYSSLSFDLTVTSLFLPLISGNKVVIFGRDNEDESVISNILREDNVDIIKLTPTHLKLILEYNIVPSRLRKFIVGGEALSSTLAKEITEKFEPFNPGIEIYNEYGPTETVVGCMIYKYNPHQDNRPTVSIGVPAHNVKLYILDSIANIVPLGVTGELYIAGEGVARGYLNRPELTAEKFDHDLWDYQDYHDEVEPFGQIKNAFGEREVHQLHQLTQIETTLNQKFLRGGPGGAVFTKSAPPGRRRQNIYRTGDLARWLPEGNMEFLGRIDQQVKIRGYRIEPGEIENLLLRHGKLKDVVVLPEEDRQQHRYLCAYIVQEESGTFDVNDLREYLAGELPAYMIPSRFSRVAGIPLTPNGKVDQRALQKLAEEINTADEYEAPANRVEEILVKVWQEVLGVKQMGVKDNFFEIGMDSIKAIQLSARLLRYRLKVQIKDIFINPTVRQLAGYVRPLDRVADQGPVEGEVLLTPIQQWFFEIHLTAGHHYNHAVMLFRQEGFEAELVTRVFSQILIHHDALRMVYQKDKKAGKIKQVNRGIGSGMFHLEVRHFKTREDIEQEIEKESNQIQGGIDLDRGPLVKLGLFKIPGGDHLLIVVHHLVIDGVSWRILLEDFSAGYDQAEKGENIRFQEKTDSFKYWAEKLYQYAQSKDLLEEIPYWRRLEESPVKPLPKDRILPTKERKIKDSETLIAALEADETEKLLKNTNQAYNTEINDILLTAVGMAAADWADVEMVLINLEGHGRESIMETVDITRTVGWFTTRFPVLLNMNHLHDLSYQIKLVKETLRKIPNKGIGYGILKYLTPGEKRNGWTPRYEEPEIGFNYLGEFGQESGASGPRFSNMKTGDTINPEFQNPQAININSVVVEGKLRLAFSYNKNEYERNTINALMDKWKEKLVNMIHHCIKKEKTEVTPSDLAQGEEISLEEFENIKEALNL